MQNVVMVVVSILVFIMVLALVLLVTTGVIDISGKDAEITAYSFSFLAFALPRGLMTKIRSRKGFVGPEFIKILIYVAIVISICFGIMSLLDTKALVSSLVGGGA